jgi:predicted nucleotidyltransferase
VSAVTTIPPALDRYLETLVETLRSQTDVEAVYLVGSAAVGAFEEALSDVDVVVVTSAELPLDERRALVAAVESLRVPARKLELVAYSRAEAAATTPRWQINLNTGEHFTFDPADESPHWFVIDRAIAEQQAVVLFGPPWSELFAPVPRADVVDAIAESLDWQQEHEPTSRSSVLNVARAWHWLESGRWISKQDAAAWLRDRVREELE